MPNDSTRRRLLRAIAAGAAGGLAGCSGDDGDATASPTGDDGDATASPTGDDRASPVETDTGADGGDAGSPSPTASGPPDAVRLAPVATGLAAPVQVAFAPDADRRYVALQGGRIRVHGPDGMRAEPLLDLGDSVTVGGEKGLLGVALHPNFAENRRLFVRYSAPSRAGTPDNYSHTFVLSEFRATEDGLGVRSGSERTILEIPEPQPNHNAGDIAFGPDGYLYVAVGDGGGGGDDDGGHVEDWYDANGGGNGQDVSRNLLGSILRIDVDGSSAVDPSDRGANAADYTVPEDNPLVGGEGLVEHYAWGLRNPWRLSIDPQGSLLPDAPDLLVGDVGQNRFEEVDLVRRGGNYGWNVREGSHCFGASDCPEETPEGRPLIPPVVEYPHAGAAVSGISVIGGVVYRGDAIPGLRGRYVFGDWDAGGRLFVADPGGDRWTTTTVAAEGLSRIRSFDRGPAGETYVVSGGRSGGVFRLAPA